MTTPAPDNSWEVAATPDLDVLPDLLTAAPVPPAPVPPIPVPPVADLSAATRAIAPSAADNSQVAAAPVALVDPLTAPLHDLSAPERAIAPSAADKSQVGAPTAAPSWPCTGCGARNSMELDNCSQCARPFLPAEDTFGFSLPGVGKLDKLDKPQRAMVAIGGIAVVTLVLVALAFLVGLVL